MSATDCNSTLYADACHLLFDCDTPEQKAKGLSLLNDAAEQNNPSALCLLGDFYLYGKKGLVVKDLEKSTRCYFQAWDSISSCFAEDSSGPIDWHHAANVCLRMGTVFLYGRCHVEDYELAEMFFQNACYGFNTLVNSGVPGSQKKLAKAHDLLLTTRTRKNQLTCSIHIYDKATLKDKPFTVYPFRAVHRSIMDVYSVDVNRFLCEQTGIPHTGENESFFYCYADETSGLTLRALGFFHHNGGNVTYHTIPESSAILFRYNDFKEWSVSLGTIAPSIYGHHRELCRRLMETYEGNPTIMKTCLDPLRSNEFPYDIQAVLVSPAQPPELVWYRPTEMQRFTLKGTLLNEPSGAFGVHCGSALYGQLAFPNGKATVFIHGFPCESELDGDESRPAQKFPYFS